MPDSTVDEPRPTPLWRVPTVAAWFGLGLLPFLTVASVFAYYVVFSHFLGDDEGYLMISVRGFLEGHPLYDSVFTQYGPFYYFYQWLLRAVLHVPLTHDATRILCVVHWLGAALVLGWAGTMLSRSALAGIIVFMQAVIHLKGIANEPGHPQELVALLLAGAVLASLRWTKSSLPVEGIALLSAVLVLVKINVGAFVVFALLLAVRCHAADRWAKGGWLGLLTGLCVLFPFALLRQHVAGDWAWQYALLTAVAIATTLLVAARFAPKCLAGLNTVYADMAVWFALPWAFALIVLMISGTTLMGFLDGVLLTPARMPGVALQPLLLPSGVRWNSAIALLVAAGVLWKHSDPKVRMAVAGAKSLLGAIGCFVLVTDAPGQLGFLLPWIWLALVPAERGGLLDRQASFPRVFLCLAAAWQGLQAYPIAGTQVALATCLLVLIFTLCLHDVWIQARTCQVARVWLKSMTESSLNLWRLLAAASLMYVFAMAWCQPHLWRRYYAELTPLELPGAERIRLRPDAVALYRNLVRYLAAECDTFVNYPGFNSLYFWTLKKPPTQLNSTGWGQLTARQQRRILDSLIQSKRPLLVVHEFVARGWTNSVPAPIETLVYFVQQQCHEVNRIGPYIIYRPERNGATSSPVR